MTYSFRITVVDNNTQKSEVFLLLNAAIKYSLDKRYTSSGNYTNQLSLTHIINQNAVTDNQFNTIFEAIAENGIKNTNKSIKVEFSAEEIPSSYQVLITETPIFICTLTQELGVMDVGPNEPNEKGVIETLRCDFVAISEVESEG